MGDRNDRGLRAHRLLTRLYPRAFRERFGAELETFFLEARDEGSHAAAFWLRTVWDTLVTAVRLRLGLGPARASGPGPVLAPGDLGRAARSLARAPVFTMWATLTLAVGIGATTAVFGVVDAVLLRPLPYEGAERLLAFGARFRHDPEGLGPGSPGDLGRFEADRGPFERIVAAGTGAVVLTGLGDAERIGTAEVSREFFETFDGRATRGRLFDDDEHRPGTQRVVVVSHDFWTSRLGSDPAVVGRTLSLDGTPHTLVGVLDPDFRPPEALVGARALWRPVRIDPDDEGDTFFLRLAGRLAPGATLADGTAHVERVYTETYADRPFVTGGATVTLHARTVGRVGSTLGRVLAAVALLLVIACVNVAGLLLARAAERRDELAVRVALGAGRRRLIGQLLGESAVLAVLAAALGSALAWAGLHVFRTRAPGGIPRLAEVALDTRVLAFAVTVSTLTVLVFGLAPALRASRRAMRVGVSPARSTPGRADRRSRTVLVATETALAVLLVAGTALMVHDLGRVVREDPGFVADGLVGMRLSLDPARTEQAAWTGFWTDLREQARALPGVTAAALTSERPYTGEGFMSIHTPEGLEAEGEGAFVTTHVVSPDYFDVMGIPVVEGRALGPDDGVAPFTAVVSESFARRFWPDGRVLGRTVLGGEPGEDDAPVYTVVGLVGDVRQRPGVDPPATLYLPLEARPWQAMALVVRTDPEATSSAATALRELVRRIDPSLPPGEIRTMTAIARDRTQTTRFYTALVASFGVLALALALVGTYATTAYAARARTREIGIRMALGARAGRVVGEVVRSSTVAVAVGTAVGLAAAWQAAGVLADRLAYVSPRDPLTYALVAGFVVVVGTMAALLPAGRAARIDPARTLREDA